MPNSKWDEGETSDFRLVINLLNATFFFFFFFKWSSEFREPRYLETVPCLIILLFTMMILLNVKEI